MDVHQKGEKEETRKKEKKNMGHGLGIKYVWTFLVEER